MGLGAIRMALPLAGIGLALQAPTTQAASDQASAFEVATVKRSAPDPGIRRFTIQGHRFLTFRTSLADLIHFAYGLHPRQISNAPSWLESEKFDTAGISEGEEQPSEKQWMAMVGKLLEDRFQLRFHRETRELPIYAIAVANGGLRLTPRKSDANGLPSLGFRGTGSLVARNASIGDLAWELQSMVLDRPVIDQTGVSGRFDFTLSWTPDEFQLNGRTAERPDASADAPPNLFTAVQQQLGLKIEAKRGPAEVLVIDHVAMPSEN